MAFTVDHQRQAVFKHFCKICKKGFRCGRALGGHMRAHGVGVESGYFDDDDEEEDPTSDWEDKLQVEASGNTKRMYALRTNPNRLKSCRACEHCGKEFLSWKSLLEHGKCTNSDDAESLVSSPPSNEDDEAAMESRGGWYKRKRSLRGKFGNIIPLSEEEDLANCLILLSKATVDPFLVEAEPEESCASASKEEDVHRPSDPLNFMTSIKFFSPQDNKAKGVNKTGLFECKACKKVFNSHQALGGHRASHKKVKGCFASRLDQNLPNNLVHGHDDDAITQENRFFKFDHINNAAALHGSSSNSKRKTKVHKCSICFREFSSGQALGGHKRCHWITSNPSSDPKFHQFNHEQQPRNKLWNIPTDKPLDLDLNLDLNLPTNVGAAAQNTCNNTTKIQVSTEICLQSWIGVNGRPNSNDVNNNSPADYNENNNNSVGSSYQHVEDETESKVKLAKLSDLKDMNTTGSSAPWLQVGIGSTADLGSDL